jgi:peptidoglycan hydrolase-like protein with peptidoglycan-binding domain
MGWLNGYEHIGIEGCTGPGTYIGKPFRWVGHTTESSPGSIDGVIRLFQGRPCSTPHFCIDPANGRKVQFIRTDWSSAALKNAYGGVETNRANAIQTEICGRAAESPQWPDEWLRFVGEHIADLVRAGININLDNHPATVGPEDGFIARPNAPQRLSFGAWYEFDGACWHQHVPENDHWDGGKNNMARIIEHAKASLGGTPPQPPPPPPPPPAPGQRVLGKGDVGQDVHSWQTRLAGRGYWIAADGIFGSMTDGITRWFQEGRGIGVDGLVGPQSLSEMEKAEAENWKPSLGGNAPSQPSQPPAPAWPGRYLMVQSPIMQGGDVRTWQQQMKDRGWPIDVDGFYGEQSRSICLKFQQEKGLAGDGIVGPVTWTKSWTAPVT